MNTSSLITVTITLRYLSESADDSDDEELNGFPSNPVHEKSLSSLLFLSFGIFLLNSVNKVIKNGGEAPRGARAIDLEDSGTVMAVVRLGRTYIHTLYMLVD